MSNTSAFIYSSTSLHPLKSISFPPFVWENRLNSLYVQFLLPPVTALIGNRIQDRRDACRVQIDDIGGVGVKREHRQHGSARFAVDSKAGNVLLKSYRRRVARHKCAWTVEDCDVLESVLR